MADISRTDLSTVIEEEYSNILLAEAVSASVALSAFRRVDLGTKTTNIPVLATIPTASFVTESGEGSTKPTAEVTWANKALVAEEIAVIIPIHENVVDDASINVLDELARQGGAAIGRALDDAVLFGTNKPVSWTSDALFDAAVAASQTVTVGTVENGDDLGGAILQAAGLVENAAWEPSTLLAPRGLRYRLANIRNADGTPIFLPSLSASPGAVDTLYGLTAGWVSGLVWDAAERDEAEAMVVDADRVIIGVRQDISVKFLDQATVGSINLAERDMVALRFKARYAYVLGDTRTDEGPDKTPVAAVIPTGS